LLKAIFGIMNSMRLTASKVYYVNTTTGNDGNDGLTASTPFKTLQRAANQAVLFNLNGFSVTINVADGVYGQVLLPPVNGSGNIRFTGNVAVPANCRIHANAGPAVIVTGGLYIFEGFRYESDAPSPLQPGAGIWSTPGGQIQVGDTTSANEFGYCFDGHMIAAKGTISIVGTDRIAGNARAHISNSSSGFTFTTGVPGPTLTIPAGVNITNFAQSTGGSTIVPVYQAINGAANVFGQKFFTATNGVIDTNGAGASYLPGNVAGTNQSGGQYV
jgi:hypothetical protein